MLQLFAGSPRAGASLQPARSFGSLSALQSPGSKGVFMIAMTLNVLVWPFSWSSPRVLRWFAFFDGGVISTGKIGTAIVLLLFVSLYLLIGLRVVFARAKQKQKERKEEAEHAAAARAHLQFLIYQERMRRQMHNAQIQRAIVRGMIDGLEAFCKQWAASHPEEPEETPVDHKR